MPTAINVRQPAINVRQRHYIDAVKAVMRDKSIAFTRRALMSMFAIMMMNTAVLSAATTPVQGERRKVTAHYQFLQPEATAALQLGSLGGTRIADYDSFSLFSVPTGAVNAIIAWARDLKLSLTFHDEFDTAVLPGGTVTLTGGVPLDTVGLGRAVDYGTGYGLYIIQFVGPVRSEWAASISSSGALEVQPINYNALIVAATPAISRSLSRFSYVQMVEPYHPFLKSYPRDLGDSDAHLVIRLANAPGATATRGRLRDLIASQDSSDTYGDGTLVVGMFSAASAALIAREPLVVGISWVPHDAPSDERVAQSLTTNVTTTGGNRVPTQPKGYVSWLATRCSYCGSLATDGAHGFRVDIADSGLDNGVSTSISDFAPTSRITAGTDFVPRRPPCASGATGAQQNDGTCCGPLSVYGCDVNTVCSLCDESYHGTAVAGFAVGNTNDTAHADSEGFYLGTGSAPSAGLVVTRIITAGSLGTTGTNITDWAADAIVHYAYIQNHSHNQYKALSGNFLVQAQRGGEYTDESHDFDVAVRSPTPITLTVSAGNENEDTYRADYAGGTAPKGWVLAPGTAKNVITAGTAESVRPSSETKDDATACNSPLRPRHDTFRNVWLYTKHGTKVTSGGHGWDTYIKPEIMVPGTQATSPLSSLVSLGECQHFGDIGDTLYSLYQMSSGTSFAAPTAAGAALIASRVYAQSLGGTPNPAAAKPSLLKAMLVASTRSMRGGINYAVAPWDYSNSTTIAAAPNDVQGFGLLNIDDIVASTPARQYVNESDQFTSSGQKKSWTYSVDDTSKPVKIALAWSDAASVANSDQSAAVDTLLLNDLDLVVDVGNGSNCRQYNGNNLTVIDPNTDLDANRGEESIEYGCDAGNVDIKNPVEKVVFFPSLANVSRFTVTVVARAITAKANASGSTNNQDFSIFVYNALPPTSLPAPASFAVTMSGTTAQLSWTGVQGAASFEIWRGPTSSAATKINGSINATVYTDATLIGNAFYVYKVRAVDRSGNAGAFSETRLVNTYGDFATDATLQASQTHVNYRHVTDLRDRINAMLAAAGAGTYNFTVAVASGLPVRADAVTELRTAVNTARVALGVSQISQFTDDTMGNTVKVQAAHIIEVRNGTQQ